MFAITACSAMERLPPVFVILVLLAFDVKSSMLSARSYISSYRYTDCHSDSADEAHESSTARLQKRLLCDPLYDPYVSNPDADSHRSTTVNLTVYPQSIEFDDLSLLLTFQSWLSMSWEDPRLNWTKDEFPDLTSVPMSSYDIWRPSLAVFKIGGVDNSQIVSSSDDCVVTMNGTVTCISVTELLTHCAPAYQHWPFDRQNCSIRMGSWGYNKDNVVYEFSEDKADMIDYTESLEWKTLSVTTTKIIHWFKGSDKADAMLSLNIILERCSASKQVIIVIPAIVLLIITLTVLWLDPMSTERMVLAGLDVICHLLCVMELNWLVPSNGGTLPSILIFYMNSFIMAGLAFFLTTFLHQLKKTSIPAPDWLTSTTSLILSNKAGQFFMLATLDPKASAALETGVVDDTYEVQSLSFFPKGNPEKLGTWHHLVTLIDRLSFVGVFLTYIITLLILIPKNDL